MIELSTEERMRFYAKVSVRHPNDCWPWRGAKCSAGYGSFAIRRRTTGAHRIAYTLRWGPIPDGLHVLHSCDNPACVNPSHLRLGTHTHNMRDKVQRGRHHGQRVTHCPKGHAFTPENTYHPSPTVRQCRTCKRDSKRERRRARCL